MHCVVAPFSVQLMFFEPSGLVSPRLPARQPTTAITAPAGALLDLDPFTTTSETMLAKKQSGVVVFPAQFGE